MRLAAFACLALAACATAPTPTSASYGDYLIARVATLNFDHASASDRYFTALAHAPHNSALIEGALVASLAAGDESRVRRAAAMAGPDDTFSYVRIVRAVDALVAGNWARAERELARLEGSAGEELIARTLAAWAAAGRGDGGDGADFSTLMSLRPYGGLFVYQRAMALDYAGRGEEALAAYRLAAQGEVRSPIGIERYADLLARRGERERAIEVLSAEANRESPALAAALVRLQAGDAGSPPLTPARGAAAGMLGLSSMFMREGDRSAGLASLTLALMLDPGFDAARFAFAQTQSDLGHDGVANAALARIQPPSPFANSARALEAWILFDAGERDAAISLARASAEGRTPHALHALADLYRSAARYAEAEPIYTELIAASPQDWRLYLARAAARDQLGRWPEAEADLRRALELSPNQPEVMNYLGYSWVDRGEHLTEGLALIERALEQRPMSGAIVDSLGWAYFRLGDYPRALELLERAVELEPAEPALNDHLGDIYWRLNRRIEARFQWQRALALEAPAPEPIRAKLEHGLPEVPAQRTARQ